MRIPRLNGIIPNNNRISLLKNLRIDISAQITRQHGVIYHSHLTMKVNNLWVRMDSEGHSYDANAFAMTQEMIIRNFELEFARTTGRVMISWHNQGRVDAEDVIIRLNMNTDAN